MNLQENIRRILRKEFLNEFHNHHKLELNDENLSKVIKKMRKKYHCSIEQINNGECDDFAVDVAEYFFGEDTAQTLFFRELNGFQLVTYGDYSKFEDELNPHTWIVYRGKHYDAEAPNGVESHYDLPIYRRQFKNKKINEVYSKDIEQIKTFLSELEFPLTLYRGLLLEKGEKINKKNLGIHWSLDEDFVNNLYYYETFGGNKMPSEDYNFYVIEAEFNRDDIDFEGTIEKRLIKDTGHFWDELTGELIQNPDMEYHPYSHEDEILVKPTSKPKIINVEEVYLDE